MDALDLNVGNITWGRILSWKFRPRSYVDLGEPVQQFRCATFRYPGTPRDHQVVVQKSGSSPSLHRERHTRILLNILHFFMHPEMCAYNLIAIEADPDNRDVRASISIERCQMSQVPGSQSLPY